MLADLQQIGVKISSYFRIVGQILAFYKEIDEQVRHWRVRVGHNEAKRGNARQSFSLLGVQGRTKSGHCPGNALTN
jgi:hypothetical protein